MAIFQSGRTSVGDLMQFDPALPGGTITNGYVLTWNTTTQLWEAQPTGGAAGAGLLSAVFSKSGKTDTNSFLYSGQVVSSITGQTIRGTNRIVQILVSNKEALASNTVFQLQKRTAAATFADISGAAVTILAGAYKGDTGAISVTIGPNEEISCYNKSGSIAYDPVLTVWTVPA